MPTVKFNDQKLSVRPDRLDLRDRPYSPPLMPLAEQFPETDEIGFFFDLYKPLILDQEGEGACTGFGLATVINHQFWFRDVVIPAMRRIADGAAPKQVIADARKEWPDERLKARRVSPAMLYQLARLYDEWDGEDYSGSSCRGAMRGWHHHGVCLDTTWPKYKKGADFEDEIDETKRNHWMKEAAERPLGAYYRVATKSISDMQAAIQQVHAIFVSAWVHDGWTRPEPAKQAQKEDLEFVPYPINWTAGDEQIGGHAFAIVGYNADGFVIQNSWGTDWGNRGFAVLTYGDWLANGIDAWVSVYGAPTKMTCWPKTKSKGSLQSSAVRAGAEIGEQPTQPWDDNIATLHSIVMGKNGRPMSRLVHAENGAEHLLICAEKRIKRWCADKPRNDHLVIYAHSGLNSEENTLRRSAILGPYFRANGIYPLFLSWTSGVLDDLEALFRDAIAAQKQRSSGGHLTPSELERQIRDTSYYTWEAIASGVSIRSIWTERKENAALSAKKNGGAMFLLAEHLRAVQMAYPELKIHLVGHSAGVFILGSLLKAFEDPRLAVNSMTLWTPACSMQYAADEIAPKIEKRIVKRDRFFIEIISDAIESEDTVAGLYKKSFLYLISRALEREHKTPLLGLVKDWNRRADERDLWARGKVMTEFPEPKVLTERQVFSATGDGPLGQRRVVTSHCTYDKSVRAVEDLISRILGRKPKHPVTDLKADQA